MTRSARREDPSRASRAFRSVARNRRLPRSPRGAGARRSPIEGIEEALEEAEFFSLRGLIDDARTILVDALARAPNHPLLLERLRELEGDPSQLRACTHDHTDPCRRDDAPSTWPRPSTRSTCSKSATRSSRPPTSIRHLDEIDVDQVFAKFKEGVRAQISDSDSSTHYDLGVAYKEMGLLPDAINEFDRREGPQLECTCRSMIGMIQLEHGRLDGAAESYIRGLSAAQKTIDQEMSLYYDIGNVYEMKGNAAEALYYFQKIARRDPGYRDVKDRIDTLSPAASPTKSVKRQLQSDDELEAAFDDLFESK